MTYIWYLLLALCFMSACISHHQLSDDEFEVNYIDLAITGHLERTYLYNNLIIGMFSDSKFFAIDSNYTHHLSIESKLNACGKVSDVQFYKNDMILLLSSRKIIVFDSVFNRKYDAENLLSKLNPNALFYNNGSFYAFNSKDFFLINNGYNTTLIDSATFYHDNINTLALGPPVYSDSMYNAYACGFGEWGGNVFFQNKKSLRTYSMPTYFGELVYYKNAYHLIHSYDSWSKYIRIKDPTKLYAETIQTKPAICCNCGSGYDEYFYKMGKPERLQWEKQRDVITYFDTNRMQTLSTFLVDDALYSLCMTDSCFLMLKHTDTVKIVKLIRKMDNRIKNYSATMKVVDKHRQVIGLRGTFWQILDSSGLDRQTDQMGIVIIKGRKIDIYESYNEKLVKSKTIER